MGRILGWALAAALTAAAATSVHAATLFESATQGPAVQNFGFGLGVNQYLAARFTLDAPAHVQEIGGYIGGSTDEHVLFGAIIALTSPSALPTGAPFDPGEVIASTTFAPGYDPDPPYREYVAPLAVDLAAGAYALVFGAGRFGSPVSDGGGMGGLNGDIPGSADYFFWDGTQWKEDGFSGARFLVFGEPIPEPSALSLLIAPLIVVCRRRKRRAG